MSYNESHVWALILVEKEKHFCCIQRVWQISNSGLLLLLCLFCIFFLHQENCLHSLSGCLLPHWVPSGWLWLWHRLGVRSGSSWLLLLQMPTSSPSLAAVLPMTALSMQRLLHPLPVSLVCHKGLHYRGNVSCTLCICHKRLGVHESSSGTACPYGIEGHCPSATWMN